MIQDSQARQTALDASRSFIVQAPAGSGKTGLLVYRLLTLLARVTQPQQVLAITFTRKATAEMRERVLALIQAAQAGEQSDDVFVQQGINLAKAVLVQDQRYGWNLLDSPHQLQVLTIDAFCAKLIISMPWLSRLGDRPRTTDQADGHYAATVEQLLNELLDPHSPILESLQTVMMELDFNYLRARQLFSSMLSKRDQWLRHLLQGELSQSRDRLELAWSGIVETQIDQLATLIPEVTLNELQALACEAADVLRANNIEESPLFVFESIDPNQAMQLAHWQGLGHLLLTKNAFRKTVTIKLGFKPKTSSKERMLDLLAQFSGDVQLLDALIEVRDLPDACFSESDWQQLLALEQVLTSLAALLQLRFRAVNECDHSEVTQRANQALRELDNPTDLGLRMDYHLQHILVDEFQDTSHGQIELLKKLTDGWTPDDGRTLFLLGDPMQSIYRFREADVSLFLQVTKNAQTGVFNNLIINSLNLSENFRSSNSLVSWFNQTFRGSFAQRHNVLTGAIAYAEASSQKTDERHAADCVLAHTQQQEAALLVDIVREEVANLPSDDAQVAILVRSRTVLAHLLPVLQAADIAYTGVDIKPLRELQGVIDVLALCKALCREDDRIAWLSLLRGPWCGLTLVELKTLVGHQRQTVWRQLIESNVDALATDTQTRLRRFMAVMRNSLAQRQQVSMSALTRWAWQALGGEDTLFDVTREDIERVFDLIANLESGGDLPSMGELDKALDGLFAKPPMVGAKVIVSTIHKAKGLQYHSVILPALSRPSRSNDKEVLMWAEYFSDAGSRLLMAPFSWREDQTGRHYQYLRALESKRDLHEAARLMYVACTRAEQKLVLLSCANEDNDTGVVKPPARNTLLATVWNSLETAFEFSPDQPDIAEQDNRLPQNLSRLSAAYQPNFNSEINWQVKQALSAQALPSQTDIEYEWATEVATGVGIVLHDLLQHSGSAILTLKADEALLNRWRAELLDLRVPENRIRVAIRRLRKAIVNIQKDTKAHFLFADYAIAQSEYALAAYEDGLIKQYRIDRTFVDNDGVRWIVDYKITDTNNPQLEAFVDEQVRLRHRTQLEKYGSLMRHLDNRPIRLAVYFPLLMQLRIWHYPL